MQKAVFPIQSNAIIIQHINMCQTLAVFRRTLGFFIARIYCGFLLL